MKIFILSGSLHYKHSFMSNLACTLEKGGHELITNKVNFKNVRDFIDIEKKVFFDDFYIKGKRVPLSHFINIDIESLDAIIVENTYPYLLYNDLEDDIPLTIFYHRDYLTPLFLLGSDILLYRFYSTVLDNIKRLYPEEYYSPKTKQKILFYHAINPDDFKYIKKKEFRGLVWPGLPKSIDFYLNKDLFHHRYYYHMYILLKKIRKYALVDHYYGITDFIEYKRLIERSEFILIITPFDAFETRRLYEAGYCGAIPVIFIQNRTAEESFNLMGFEDGINCIFFRSMADLKDFDRSDYTINQIKQMSNNVHRLIMAKFTYKVRIRELISIIKNKNIREEKPFEIPSRQKGIYKKYYIPNTTFDKNIDLKEIEKRIENMKNLFLNHGHKAYVIMFGQILKMLIKKRDDLINESKHIAYIGLTR